MISTFMNLGDYRCSYGLHYKTRLERLVRMILAIPVILESYKLVLSLLLSSFLNLKKKLEDQGPLVEATTKTEAFIALDSRVVVVVGV